MGSLILCTGKRAEVPFVFPGSHRELYTIEELCYFIYNHIDTMTDDMFDRSLVQWLGGQEELREVSWKMERLIDHHNSLKDKVITLLCACDYYREKEIRDLLLVMNQLEAMSFPERCRQKGIRLLEKGRYKEAESFFQKLLKPEAAKQFTPEEYGDILHNLAVVHIHTASYGEAAKEFKASYERNHRRETLRQYLTALKLSEQKSLYEKELVRLEVDKELEQEVSTALEQKGREAKRLPEYVRLQIISDRKRQGQVSGYYESVGAMIEKWKQEYKEEASG